jgi:hypothetical protein
MIDGGSADEAALDELRERGGKEKEPGDHDFATLAMTIKQFGRHCTYR